MVGLALTALGLLQDAAARTHTWGGASSGLGTPGGRKSQEAPGATGPAQPYRGIGQAACPRLSGAGVWLSTQGTGKEAQQAGGLSVFPPSLG